MPLLSKLFIKGMVCQRCMTVITTELKTIGLTPVKVELGAVTVLSDHGVIDMDKVARQLAPHGFGLVEDRKLNTIRQVKDLVATVYSGEYDFPERFRFSDLVVKQLAKDYNTISTLFSGVEHITLEQYIIQYRIDKTKELLADPRHTLSDIAFRLNYSSVAHLSRQFLQVAGITTSAYKKGLEPVDQIHHSNTK